MFSTLATRVLSVVCALLLLVGCGESVDPPDGVTIEQDATAPWANPDTVSVQVRGEIVGGAVAWNDLSPTVQSWLDEKGYVEERTEVNKRMPDQDSAVGRRYYIHAY